MVIDEGEKSRSRCSTFESLRAFRDFPHKLRVASPPWNKILKITWLYDWVLSGLKISKRRRKGEKWREIDDCSEKACQESPAFVTLNRLWRSLTGSDCVAYQSASRWWSECSVPQTALKQLRSHSVLSKNIWAPEKMQSRGETKGMTSATKSLWHSQWGIR